ncbi:hypothetical protein ANAEL_03783 [Anaerolineales bacterium]|nr:hypothetical protein ANAEL_03783 [Anaerolineales bacterium]
MGFFGKRTRRGGIIIAAFLALSILATACSQANTSSSSAGINHGTMNGGMAVESASIATPQTTGEHSDMQTGHSTTPVTTAQTTSGHTDSHGHAEETANASTPDKGLILGTFGAVNGMVIALAAVLKTRTPKKKRAEDAIQQVSSTGGLAE